MDKMKMESPDMTAQNIDRIAALFPNCVTETVDENGKLKRAINFELLKQMLSPDVVDGDERYEFTWVGKKAAIVEANKPIRKTLRPCKEESKDWDSTENLYIEGDNLEVLKLLQESYLGKVKMIYIDPPYNTGSDFIYADNFMRSQEEENEQMGMYDEDGDRLFKNTDTNGRFHSDWCSMIYSRLMLARNLLTDDGVIFISIDDNEQENLKKCCDEVFGGQNFVATFPWRKRTAKSDVPFGVSQDCEWVICYAKSGKFAARVAGTERKYFETPDFPGRPWRIHDLTKQTTASERPNSFFPMVNPKTGEEYPANPNRTWAITEETFKFYYSVDRIVFPGDYDFLNITKPALRYWKEDDVKKSGDMFGMMPVSTKLPDNIGMSLDGTKEITALFDGKIFSFPKTVSLIKFFVDISTKLDKEAIILDFFSGSATTAHAVMQLNAEDGGHRKFIMVQLPEPCDEKSECATIQTATLLHTTSRWLTVPYSPSIKIWRSLPSQTIFLTISLIKVRFSSIVSVWKLSLKLDNAVDSISTWISLSAMMFTSLCRRAFSSFMEASSLSSSVILAFTRSMNAAPKLPCDSVLIRLSISLLHFLILSSMTATGLFCVCPCKSRFSFSSSL